MATESKEVDVVQEDGTIIQQTYNTESARLVYDDGTEITPMIVRDVEEESERQNQSVTTLCGNRRSTDDGEGKTVYTVQAYVDVETKEQLQQKQGIPCTFFNDVSLGGATTAYIKKLGTAISNEMNAIVRNGEKTVPYDVQIELEVE